jgi:hypothetical protein
VYALARHMKKGMTSVPGSVAVFGGMSWSGMGLVQQLLSVGSVVLAGRIV